MHTVKHQILGVCSKQYYYYYYYYYYNNNNNNNIVKKNPDFELKFKTRDFLFWKDIEELQLNNEELNLYQDTVDAMHRAVIYAGIYHTSPKTLL